VVINNLDQTPTLLRNVMANGNHWVGLKLIGGPKSPRDAIGAKVFLTAGVHFGLGKTAKVDKLEIAWPSETSKRSHCQP